MSLSIDIYIIRIGTIDLHSVLEVEPVSPLDIR